MNAQQQLLKLTVQYNGAKETFRTKYDHSDKAFLWGMKTLRDVYEDSKRMIDQGKDGVKNFIEYLAEINIQPTFLQETK